MSAERKTLAERLVGRVDKGPHPQGCWLWIGAKMPNGYGLIWRHGSNALVHRWAYRLAKGSIPAGLLVLHSCDVRLCVNPDHLRVGTIQDNHRDAVERRRHARGQTAGHAKLTDEKVLALRAFTWNDVMPLVALEPFMGVDRATVGRIIRRKIWRHL